VADDLRVQVDPGADYGRERFKGGGHLAGEDNLAVAVEDDEEQGSGMEIDAGIESGTGRGGVKVRILKASCWLVGAGHVRRRCHEAGLPCAIRYVGPVGGGD
jgi:hypothetical protein